MTRKHLKRIAPLLALGIFVLALWALSRVLGEYRLSDIAAQLRAVPPGRLARGAGLTVLTYLVLTLYDHLGLRHVGRSLPPGQVTLASFTSYAFGRNVGFSLLTGGSVRFRFYLAWGVPATGIARLIAFAALGFCRGMATMGGLIVLLAPGPLPDLPRLPIHYLRPFGGLALAAVGGYLLLTALRRQPVQWRGRHLPLPSPRQALGQVAIGVCDWTLTASVLYVLLPPEAALSLPHFLQIYLLAQLAVILSHVPGGLGVFESAVLLLAPSLSAPALFGALLLYRVLFFLLPFVLALALLGAFEWRQRR